VGPVLLSTNIYEFVDSWRERGGEERSERERVGEGSTVLIVLIDKIAKIQFQVEFHAILGNGIGIILESTKIVLS
jgi:hypothetical protein